MPAGKLASGGKAGGKGAKAGGGAQAAADPWLLSLKKQAWQMRVCQRKSIVTVLEELQEEEEDGVELTQSKVEAYVSEVEALRNSLGLQWTWFEEELLAGQYDAQLGGSAPFAPPLRVTPASPSLAPSQPAASHVNGVNSGGGWRSPGASKRSPESSGRSTPKTTTPKFRRQDSPSDPPPMQMHEAPQPQKKLVVPTEVWLAAKEHRKSNFFAAAVLKTAGGAPHAHSVLFAVLGLAEVPEAINLGLASRGFFGALLAAPSAAGFAYDLQDGGGANGEVCAAAAAHFWWSAGCRVGGGCDAKRFPAAVLSIPFAGDAAFSVVSWARRRQFAARVGEGVAAPLVLVAPQPGLTGAFAELGPFLEPEPMEDGVRISETSRCYLGPDRLLVCDGTQNFQVVDVWRRHWEKVPGQKAVALPPALRSSQGTHPVAVTASWPVRGNPHCSTAGGVLVARPPTKRGVESSTDAFEWLQLPSFTNEEVPCAAPADPPKRQVSASTSPPLLPSPAAAVSSARLSPKASPMLKALASPLSGAAASPKLGCAAALAASPHVLAAASPHAASPHSHQLLPPASSGGSLLRESVPLDRVVAATSAAPAGGAHGALEVASAWPLPGNRVLLLVREPDAAQAADKSPGPWGGHHWLQVWDFAKLQGGTQAEASPSPLASAPVMCPVTAIHVDAAGGGRNLLLCGLASGGLQLRELPPEAGADPARPCAFAKPLRTWAHLGATVGRPPEYRPIRHVVLRGAGGIAVVAQALSVMAHDCRGENPAVQLLPVPGGPGRLCRAKEVAAVRPVGLSGFAVCTQTHVYAFQAAGSSAPVLVAAVELPVVRGFDGPAVLDFDATPYDFLVVLASAAASRGFYRNALCCAWPTELCPAWSRGDQAAPWYETGVEEEEADEGDDGPPAQARRRAVFYLRGWAPSSGEGSPSSASKARPADLLQVEAPAVCLNRALLGAYGAATIDSFCLHSAPAPTASVGAPGGRQPGGFGGSPLLAVSAQSAGVAVFRWGVEVSPEIQRLRERNLREAAKEAAKKEREASQLRLTRLKQKLQETERLEERLKEKGAEALSEEERAKLQRKGQVEMEVDRLTRELGLDEAQEDSDESEDEDVHPHGAQKGVATLSPAAQARRKEKEKQQKEHHDNKRVLQKERQKNRDRKFED